MASPYEIAIHISMQNAVSPVLALIAKDMLGLQMSAKKLEDAFDKVGGKLKLMAAGGAAAFGGVEMVRGVLDLASAGEKLLRQQNMLVATGMKLRDVNAETAQIYKKILPQVPTATSDGALRVFSELRSVVGADKAGEVLAFSLKAQELLSRLPGGTDNDAFKMWRTTEMKGLAVSDTPVAKQMIEAMMKDIQGSMGKLSASDFQAMAARGGTSFQRATIDAITGPLAVLASDMGGEAVGVMMATTYNTLTGATQLSKTQFKAYEESGLIDPSLGYIDSHGRVVMKPGAIRGSIAGAHDIPGWIQSSEPMIRAHAEELSKSSKYSGQSVEDIEGIILAQMGRNRNVIKMFNDLTAQSMLDQQQKDITLWRQQMGVDEGYANMMGTPWAKSTMGPGGLRSEAASDNAGRSHSEMGDYTSVMKAFQSQWESLMQAVGGPVAKGMIPVLQSLTAEFTKAGQWAEKHPDAIKYIAEGIAAVGAAMVVLGGAAVIAGAAALLPGGIVAVAIAGIGIALSAMAAMNWSTVAADFNMLVAAMGAFFHVLDSIPGRLGFVAQKSTDPYTDSQIAASYMRQNGLGGRGNVGHEEANGRALMGMPPMQTVVVNQTSNLIVDGRALASVVEKYIVNGNRSVNSSSGHDGRADWSATDANSFH